MCGFGGEVGVSGRVYYYLQLNSLVVSGLCVRSLCPVFDLVLVLVFFTLTFSYLLTYYGLLTFTNYYYYMLSLSFCCRFVSLSLSFCVVLFCLVSICFVLFC